MRVHEVGQLAAIGNDKGNVCLIEFSENLAVTNKNDKTLLTHVSIVFLPFFAPTLACLLLICVSPDV